MRSIARNEQRAKHERHPAEEPAEVVKEAKVQCVTGKEVGHRLRLMRTSSSLPTAHTIKQVTLGLRKSY